MKFPVLLLALLTVWGGFASAGERAPAAGASSEDPPQFLRINIQSYNIRTSPEFSFKKTDNIAFQSAKGAIFAVKRVVQMDNGLAVNIIVDGQDRWVYVPNWRRHDFQLCESESCFSEVTRLLELINSQNISAARMAECGIPLTAEGTVVRHEHPRVVDVEALPPGRSDRELAAHERELSPEARAISSGPLATTPLWESAVPGTGRRWTQMLTESIHRYGKDLLNTRSLSDQQHWCPNYSSLSEPQRKEFWLHLFNGIARYESNFKTNVTFNEATYRNVYRGPINPNTYSQGLFQLSYGSANQRAYKPACRFDYGRDRYKDISDSSLTIYDPKLQMDCAVGIMNYWVKKDRGLGLSSKRGGARFWSTLRSSNPATRRVIQSLKRYSPCWR